MPSPIQDPGESQALVNLFGIKGRLPLNLDNVVVPVALVADLTNTPYSAIGRGNAARRQGAAGAGTYAAIAIEPGPGLICRVDTLTIENVAAGVREFEVRALTPAQWAGVTSVANGQAIDLNSPYTAGALPERLASICHSCHIAAVVGNILLRITMPQQTTQTFDLGLCLYGDDSVGPIRLGTWLLTANEECNVSYTISEFKNKG